MSKFEELCQAYANARKQYQESKDACLDFSKIFVEQMSNYFQCPINQENLTFYEDASLHFQISITLYENPQTPDTSEYETVVLSLSVEKVIDNYIVTVYPWGQDFKLFWNEFNKFEEVYDYLFERINNSYSNGLHLLPEEENKIRNIGFAEF